MNYKSIKISVLCAAAAVAGSFGVSAMLASGEATVPAGAPALAIAPVTETTTATWDFSNSTVMDATMAFSGSTAEGTVACGENNGIEMTVLANGASFRDNNGNIQVRSGAEFRIPVATTEDVVTVKGYPNYSYYTISGVAATEAETSYKAKYSDVERGYVSVVSTDNNNYYYSLSVTLQPEKQLASLTDEPATATFPFDLGTEKQTATFSNAAYFLASKVVYGSAVILDGIDNKGNNQTWFRPESKASKADESNAIQFLIQPRFGLKFTPTKVSFKATRYGTDGGSLDISWVNPDGSTITLATGQKPQRDNATPNTSEYSYDVTGAKVDEGACGLYVNLYSLDNNKRIGFADIVIEGTLSGQEREVPMLASFTANGVEYQADDVFVANGETYEATVELAAAETMISASNPITAVAIAGNIGVITYAGDNTTATATIPLTLDDITLKYVVTFVRKPYFTLTYYNTDGTTVMGTQKVEKDAPIANFDVDYATATAQDGYKVRGWFAQAILGRKYTTEEIITGDIDLYAIATEIEEPSDYKKYEFNLKDQYFYPEDHEAFNTADGYFHDTTHGWAFNNGHKIELLVGKKAAISIAICRYGDANAKVNVTDAAGTVLETLPVRSADEIDGEVVAYQYEGTPGTLTLDFETEGECYIHSIKIVNNSEVNYQADGQWYYVNPGDASSLIDVIEAVSAANATKDAERAYVFIPDGTYDLQTTVLTNISGHNISLIGQSMEGTLIVNKPHYTTEAIDKTATLMNTGTGLYIQDLTIQNALDYYATIAGNQVGGRAVALWDKGINTICKNVTLLSCQDTYYSNNLEGVYYWADCDIHGTVDFFCGEGKMFFENGTITVEMRNSNGKGECTLTAPATAAGSRYGYVFSNCKIKNYAERFNFGRAWQNEPRVAYINTTLLDDDKISSSRFTTNGMTVAAKEFVEYNTMDKNGNTISPASNVLTFIKDANVNTMETILTAAQAAEFDYEKVFTDWDPRALSTQVAAPVAQIKDGTISWEAVDGAKGYAIFKGGVLEAIVTEGTSRAAAGTAADNYTIRSINSMGGLGAAGHVDGSSGLTDISASSSEVVATVYYNIQGLAVSADYKGVVIKVDTLSDGRVATSKVIRR
ncbi:MAG: pectinesterase family protein [Lachnoclostridium sp.]|nr:pectinesterase family protein [Lachnoclostridium sp.]